MLNDDNVSYYRFTGPARLDKQVHTLEGLVRGIGIDGEVSNAEIIALTDWLNENVEFHHLHPFNEIVPVLREALADNHIDDEERADLLWLCQRLTSNDDGYYDLVTGDMQRLQGLIGGISADGIITPEELRGLSD